MTGGQPVTRASRSRLPSEPDPDSASCCSTQASVQPVSRRPPARVHTRLGHAAVTAYCSMPAATWCMWVRYEALACSRCTWAVKSVPSLAVAAAAVASVSTAPAASVSMAAAAVASVSTVAAAGGRRASWRYCRKEAMSKSSDVSPAGWRMWGREEKLVRRCEACVSIVVITAVVRHVSDTNFQKNPSEHRILYPQS